MEKKAGEATHIDKVMVMRVLCSLSQKLRSVLSA
jgi:hypothetical protein